MVDNKKNDENAGKAHAITLGALGSQLSSVRNQMSTAVGNRDQAAIANLKEKEKDLMTKMDEHMNRQGE